MVECTRSFVKASRVPGVRESELLKIEVMAEFVTQGAEKRAKGCNLFPHCRAHPDPDHPAIGAVVSEQFARPAFANPQRARRENTNVALGHGIERCHFTEQVGAGLSDPCGISVLRSAFEQHNFNRKSSDAPGPGGLSL